jgi:hypothetical protein
MLHKDTGCQIPEHSYGYRSGSSYQGNDLDHGGTFHHGLIEIDDTPQLDQSLD